MATDLEAEIFGAETQEDDLPEEFKTMSADDIQRRWALRQYSRHYYALFAQMKMK